MTRHFVLITAILIAAFVVTGVLACSSGSSAGGSVTVGTPVNASFGTSQPTDDQGKPYVDYALKVGAAGNYQIDLVSKNTETYDPYISLRQGANEIASDDDGAGDLNSRLTKELQPGDYTVRVTRFGDGQIDSAVDFTLSITKSGG